MNHKEAKEYMAQREINLSRLALGVCHRKLVKDVDMIYTARPLKHWEPNITPSLRSWALKHGTDNK
jgi:hypothetical protein